MTEYSTRRSRRTALTGIGIRVGGAAILLTSEVILARLMNMSSFGAYQFALSWALLLAFFCPLGLDSGAQRFLPELTSGNRLSEAAHFLKYSARMTAGSTTLAVACLLAAGYVLRGTAIGTSLLMAAFVLPGLSAMQLRTGILRASGLLIRSEWPKQVLLPGLVTIGALWVAAQTGSELTALAAVLIAAVSATVAAVVAWLPVQPRHESRGRTPVDAQTKKSWRRTSVYLLAVTSASVLLSRTDILMLGSLASTESAGLYSAASRLSSVMAFGLSGLGMYAASGFALHFVRREVEELRRSVRWVARVSVAFGGLIFLLILVGGRLALGAYGSEFLDAYPSLLILGTGQLVNVAAGANVLLLTMTDNHRPVTLVMSLSAALNIVLNYLLIPTWGAMGAAFATALSMAAWNIILVFVGWRRLRIVSLPH